MSAALTKNLAQRHSVLTVSFVAQVVVRMKDRSLLVQDDVVYSLKDENKEFEIDSNYNRTRLLISRLSSYSLLEHTTLFMNGTEFCKTEQ